MNVRKFRPPMRLARMIKASGGKMVRESMMDCDEALAALREPCLVSIDALMAELSAQFGPRSPRGFGDIERVFQIACDLIDASSGAQDLHIEGAAHSLCRLLDLFREAGRADWKAVDVHVEVLKFLRAAGPSTPSAAREKMISGLRRVVDRVSAALGITAEPEQASHL